MRLNSSIVGALMCLSAILHTACGSPGAVLSSARGGPAPPSYSKAVAESAGPSLSIEFETPHDQPPDYDEATQNPPPYSPSPITSHDLDPLIVNHIQASLKTYGPRELGGFIREFDTDSPCRIHFDYPGNEPESFKPRLIHDHERFGVRSMSYRFFFKPGTSHTTTIIEDFQGVGELRLCD
ncbi:hypothetical protein FB446DRAFT_727813 [Lentinula raphanica]|nr:hypothetical protein FB446DRAFT_727813 [Lentinula raphanica]